MMFSELVMALEADIRNDHTEEDFNLWEHFGNICHLYPDLSPLCKMIPHRFKLKDDRVDLICQCLRIFNKNTI